MSTKMFILIKLYGIIYTKEGEKVNYTKTLREFCFSNKGKIFDVMYEQKTRFSLIPYKTLLKILNRLEDEEVITNISKGVYLINGDNSNLEQAIMNYYVDNFNGMLVGKAMYNYYDIGTLDDDKIEIYTRIVTANNKTIGKFRLISYNVYFYKEVIGLITVLELIEKVSNIKDINYIRYNEEKEYGIHCYTDEIFKEIIAAHNYKYSTIVTLEILLNENNIKNNIIRIYQENYKNAF